MSRNTLRWLVGAIALGAVLFPVGRFVVAQFQAGAQSDEAMFRVVKARTDARNEAARKLSNPEAITCVMVGTGSPMPSERAQACTALFVGGQFLLFDSGDGAARALEAFDLPVATITAVFLTHYHSDHFADLGEVIDRSWIQGRRHLLPVYGPTGIVELLDGIRQAYRLEYGYRTAHHGAAVMPSEFSAASANPFEVATGDEPIVVYDHEGVTVKTFAVNHPPVQPAVGYRVEHRGKVVVISGDTTAVESLETASADADLLCAEVMNMAVISQLERASERLGNKSNAHILHDIRDYHIDVHELGRLAERAKVKRLALTHLAPPANKAAAALVFKKPVSEEYTGEIVVGEDGTKIVIPLE